MNLSQTPIVYDPREAPYTLVEGTAIKGTDTKATLVPVAAPTFYPFRDGVRETCVTASTLYPTEGLGDNGEVVVHNEVIEPLERARARVREAGFDIAVVSGFGTPMRAQKKFAEIMKRLETVFKEQKKKYPSTADEIRIGRLASTIGTPGAVSTRSYPTKAKRILHGMYDENYSGVLDLPKYDVFKLAHELLTYRGNTQKFSDHYTDDICPVIVSTAIGEENFGRTLQCVLTLPDQPERALNMGIGVDIPHPSLQATNAFEDMTLNRLLFLVRDNPLALAYFKECDEPADEQIVEDIKLRRRVLYHAMTSEGFVRGKRQGMFTLPAEPTDLPPRHHMLAQGTAFGHVW